MLTKEQTQRYLRQIVIPEIGSSGQKKLLEASLLIYCDSISNSAVMLYYLSAMGIGKISCSADSIEGYEFIFQKARGLNPDLEIGMADYTANYDAIIVLCEKAVPNLIINTSDIPIIFSAAAGDCGYIRKIRGNESNAPVVDEIRDFFAKNKDFEYTPLFKMAYLGFICALTASEAVKALLAIGSNIEQPLQFNLSTYSFLNGQVDSKKTDNKAELESARKRLQNARVLIVGSGGLGSPNAYMLTMSGVGRLGLIDYDTVEISNLNRQILHSTDTVGMAKVKSAEKFLKSLNRNTEIRIYEDKFSLENAEVIVADYDLVIEGLDNLPNRYLLNDICYILKKPLIESGVSLFGGLVTTLIPDKGPCYRCIFPEASEQKAPSPPFDPGILGAVPGVMGMLQTIESIKLLTGIGVPLLNKMILFDALNTDFTILDIEKTPHCKLCGIK